MKDDESGEPAKYSMYFAENWQKRKLESLFVDYNGRFQRWTYPWSLNTDYLVKTFGEFLNLNLANCLCDAHKNLLKAVCEKLMTDAKTVITYAKQKREQIKD